MYGGKDRPITGTFYEERTLELESKPTESAEAPKNYKGVRLLAESLYAGAMALAARKLTILASVQAKQCLALLKLLPSNTMEECATSQTNVGEMALPDFLDYDIARRKFIDAGLAF